MACLYCGKEIGPIRILRDTEFCSPKHRKEYKDRLRKVLVQVGEPQTVPTQVAPFRDPQRPVGGPRYRAAASFDFSTVPHATQLPRGWTLAIPEAGDGVLARLDLIACDLSTAPARRSLADALPYFVKTATSLSTPATGVGTVVLRTPDGQLLSDPIALPYPEAHLDSRDVESCVPAPAKHSWTLAFPAFTLSAAACEELQEAAEPAPSEAWMAPPAPKPAVNGSGRPLNPPEPAAAQFNGPLSVPEAARPADESPLQPPLCETWAAIPAPAAANADLKRAEPSFAPVAPVAAAPSLAGFEIPTPLLPPGDATWMPLAQSEPAAREVCVSAVQHPVAFSSVPLCFTPFLLEPIRDTVPDSDDTALESYAAEPETPIAPPRTAGARATSLSPVNSTPPLVARPVSDPVPAVPVTVPAAAAERPHTEVPQFGLFPIDYRCAASLAAPRAKWSCASRPMLLQMPRFVVRPVFDRLEDQAAEKPERKRPAFAEIFTMPDAAALTRRKEARHAFTAIAASVTVAMALWFGANAGKFGKDLLNRQAAEEIAAAARLRSRVPGAADSGSAPVRGLQTPPDAFTHPVAWVRSAAAKRATVQLADSFDHGMAAWGVRAKGWAPGWSHSADGYVRPGQLALFQPTLSYTDYRMEFFGQIENKSMSWVVRGKDTQNYYAMKFSIVEPGLRPIISMAHYPVVGGKQGHKVEVPLSVMVHNNTPYHVAVVVKGSHYTASIEGQEVDSWSDETLPAGGVGFFAEAGARARIYWMKVSKNDDWFGRLCNRIANAAESGESASLEPPSVPVPSPQRPAPLPATAALWPAETGETTFGKLQRAKGSWKGEIEKWSS